MPYIELKRREQLDSEVNALARKISNTIGTNELSLMVAGDFTYALYRLFGMIFCAGSKRYWQRALGFGCLLCAVLEAYRKFHAPYEDEAIKRNGDI